jgi:hypothetical protein
MYILIAVEPENKEDWRKIKKVVSDSLFENDIHYSMIDQKLGRLPKNFDVELKRRE